VDLFVIGCTTCRQRLKVRDLALVGQIQACPNCGSMVHIQPPPDWKPPADAPTTKAPVQPASPSNPKTETAKAETKNAAPANGGTTSRPNSPARQGPAFVPPTATPAGLPTGQPNDPSVRETVFDKDFDDIGKLLEPGSDKNRPGKPPGGTSNQITASAIDGITPPSNGKRTVIINRDLPGANHGEAKKPSGKTNATPSFPAAKVAANDDGELAIPPSSGSGSGSFAGGLPGPDSDSATSGLSGSFSLGLPAAQEKEGRRSLLLTGIVIATALGIAVTVLAAAIAKPWLSLPSRRISKIPNTGIASPVVAEANKENAPEETTTPATTNQNPDSHPVDDESTNPNAQTSQANATSPEVEIPDEPPESTTGATPDVDSHDPLQMLDDPKKGSGEEEEPSSDGALGSSKLTRLISDSSFDDTPKGELPKTDTETESSADGVSRPRPPMKAIDLKARLADKIDGIDIPGVPVDAFVNMMSDMSTIPVSLDPEGLLASGATPQTPVQGKLLKVTVESALRDALAKQKLDLVTQDGTLVVVASREQRTQVYKVSDLASTEGDLNDLVALVEKILIAPSHPAVSEPDSGEVEPPSDDEPAGEELAESSTPAAIRAEKGQLVADLDALGHFQLRRTLDAVRAARGITLRENVPEASCKPQGYEASCSDALGAPLKLNFSHGDLLREILSRFASEAKCQILIDWSALAEAGWPKEADATLVVAGKPLAGALEDLLKPMDLTCVPVGPGWLQVTTPQALSRQAAIDFYSIADLAKTSDEGAQWIASLTGEVNGEHRQFAFDSTSGLLIAKLSTADHLAVRKAIESRRREVSTAGK
jgi:hypothetical protein